MRPEKQNLTKEYQTRLNGSPFFIVVDYKGLHVGHWTELRKRLIKAGAEVHVVKNSIFRIAADRKVACYVHTRSVGTIEPGSTTESMEEVIAGAAITGASIHVVHITSMSLKQTGLALEMIDDPRDLFFFDGGHC